MMDFSPFIESLNRTFSDMVGLELVNGPYEEVTGGETLADVSVNIGLTGDVKASLLLTADERAALLITQKTTGKQNVNLGDRIVSDTMGELLNMIVGSAQRHAKIKFEFSLPVNIEGRRHKVRTIFNAGFRRVISKMQGEEVGLYLFEESSK